MSHIADWQKHDRVCASCLGDPVLRSHVASEGATDTCRHCGTQAATIALHELADWVDEVFREYYRPVEHGSTPDEIIAELLQDDDTGLSEALVRILADREWRDVSKGADAMFDAGTAYEFNEDQTYPAELVAQWVRFEDEVKYSKRSFNPSAEQFLDQLIQEARSLAGDKHVVRLKKGDHIWRARAAASVKAVKEILDDPLTHLSAPRRELRTAGRMNAAGTAVLYAAFTPDTCIAEIRPWVGGFAVVGRLDVLDELKLLDLAWFDRDMVLPSLFDGNYRWQAEVSRFLGRLSRLISQPVQPGTDAIEYAHTQVFAEYLGSAAGFDGVIYSSSVVQNSDDLTAQHDRTNDNIALFRGDGIIVGADSVVERPRRNWDGALLEPIERRLAVLELARDSVAVCRVSGLQVKHERVFDIGDDFMSAADLDEGW